MHNLLCKSGSSLNEVANRQKASPQCFTGIEDIPFDIWDALVAGTDMDTRIRYWTSLEASTSATTGEFRYVLLFDNEGKPRALCAFQYVHFDVDQVLEKISRFKKLARGIVNLLTRPYHRLLVGGSVWLSGEHGRWASDANDMKNSQREAANFLMEQDNSIYAVLLKDYPGNDAIKGYHRFEVDPAMELDLQPFNSVDAYSDAFRSKYRQRMRSAMKKSKQIISWELDKEQIEIRDSELMGLFYQVVSDDLFCLSLPPTGYISALKKSLGDAFTVTGYFLKDRLIGFRASLHYDGTTHAYMVGFSRDHNQQYKLYQRMLYDYVREGIEAGSKLLDLGRTALEIKSCLGAEPRQMFLHIRFRYPCVHALIKPVFRRLGPTPWEPRNPFSTS